ncbi:hypothetical protein ACFLZ0_02295 [Patescibacteria group bacterium]
MSLKKILIILIIVTTIIIGSLLLYDFFFQETPKIEEQFVKDNTIIIGENETSLSSIKINLISKEPILSPIADGNLVKYYSALSGNVLQSNFDGSEQFIISSDTLTNLLKTKWSPIDKNKVISFFKQKDEQIKKYFYNFKSKESAMLEKNISSVDWSPTEDKIVYQYFDIQSGLNNINIANPDGSDWNSILQTRIKDIIVEWPSSNQIIIRTKPSGLAKSVIYTINPSGENFRKLIDNTYGLTTLWSPQGDKLLFSETNSQGENLKLNLFNTNDYTIRELDFITLPEKCVWSQDNITAYCAVPTIIADKAVLPDDYYKDLLEFTDFFYKINLNTGQKSLLAKSDILSIGIDASQLLLDNQENYLIFVNKKDGLLYSLEL